MKVSIHRIELDGKITLQESAGIAIVTICRPQYKNALTTKMWKELCEIGKSITNNPKTRVVILRGSGNQFSAGSDIKEFMRMTMDEVDQAFNVMEEAISIFEKLPIPTVGAINGVALGGGLELALSCDIRVGTPITQMGIPIGRLGITLSQKFVKRILDLIGPSRTKDLVYTGRIMNAQESHNLGLLNYLLTEEQNIDHYVLRFAKTISEQSPASLRAVKEAVAFCQPMHEITWSRRLVPNSVDPVDFAEGIKAFVEKRKPKFKRG